MTVRPLVRVRLRRTRTRASGNYNVTLTVTDDKAATGTVSHQVTVNSVVVLAQDAFGRNVTNGWGTADVGGAWSTVSTASNFVVNGIGYIKMANPGSGPCDLPLRSEFDGHPGAGQRRS